MSSRRDPGGEGEAVSEERVFRTACCDHSLCEHSLMDRITLLEERLTKLDGPGPGARVGCIERALWGMHSFQEGMRDVLDRLDALEEARLPAAPAPELVPEPEPDWGEALDELISDAGCGYANAAAQLVRRVRAYDARNRKP